MDFTAYVCDSAATRPSSQITLGRLVYYTMYINWLRRLGINLSLHTSTKSKLTATAYFSCEIITLTLDGRASELELASDRTSLLSSFCKVHCTYTIRCDCIPGMLTRPEVDEAEAEIALTF